MEETVDFLRLSLSPPFSEDSVVGAEPITYSLPHPPSNSGNTIVVDLSFMLEDNDIDSSFLSLSLPFYENLSNPTISSKVSKSPNLVASKPIGNNTPPPSSSAAAPSTDLCLSLPYTPDTTSSTITTFQSSIGIQHSSAKRSLFQETGEHKFVSNPTLSLFPEVSENLAFSKQIGNNTPPPLPLSSAEGPSTDLCLSLPYTPNTTSSTITNLQCSIGSQHSSAKRSLFQESGEQKFVTIKKIKVTKDSMANIPKRPLEVVPAVEGEEEGHWIIKPLTKSDVNGASRLLLPRKDVKNYVLPCMKVEEQAKICDELSGVDVTVYDMDTQTEHILTLKKWPATNSFHLVKAWTSEFVKRRNLKEDDVISIRWEKNNYRFCFRVHMRNQVDAV